MPIELYAKSPFDNSSRITNNDPIQKFKTELESMVSNNLSLKGLEVVKGSLNLEQDSDAYSFKVKGSEFVGAEKIMSALKDLNEKGLIVANSISLGAKDNSNNYDVFIKPS
jgi:hypothetical protein